MKATSSAKARPKLPSEAFILGPIVGLGFRVLGVLGFKGPNVGLLRGLGFREGLLSFRALGPSEAFLRIPNFGGSSGV